MFGRKSRRQLAAENVVLRDQLKGCRAACKYWHGEYRRKLNDHGDALVRIKQLLPPDAHERRS